MVREGGANVRANSNHEETPEARREGEEIVAAQQQF
jgi:hypothetical protein